MTSKQAWALFQKTGNIEAYLLYKERQAVESAEIGAFERNTEACIQKLKDL